MISSQISSVVKTFQDQHISFIIFVDGCVPEDKVWTSVKRREKDVKICHSLWDALQRGGECVSRDPLLPVLAKKAMIETLMSLKVKIVQTEEEADLEVGIGLV